MFFWIISGVAFLVGCLAFASLVHNILILRTPYIPTPLGVVSAMVDLAQLLGYETVYDLGAGDGRLLIEAKRKFPSIKAIGYEIAPIAWLLGWFRIRRSKVTIDWRFQSALHQSFKDADVVFLYVTPFLMNALAPLLKRDLKPGSRVISHVFTFPGKEPASSISVQGKTIWLYRF